jgi:hypothetical protein
MPDRKNSGTKATIMISVALRIEALISLDASKTTLNDDLRSLSGN